MSQVNDLRQIDGFDYEIAPSGQVYSMARVVMRSNGRPHTVVRKQLRPTWNGDHWQVHLVRDGKKHTRYVHHLVLEIFVSPRPEGMRGLHRDDNPDHNHVGNLYWGTMSENAFDRVRNGRDHNANKTACKRGHALIGQNLAPWSKPSSRVCLSCNRTNTLARWHGRQKDEGWLQRISDEKFAAIMQGAVQ